jgi:hypothetical protein
VLSSHVVLQSIESSILWYVSTNFAGVVQKLPEGFFYVWIYKGDFVLSIECFRLLFFKGSDLLSKYHLMIKKRWEYLIGNAAFENYIYLGHVLSANGAFCLLTQNSHSSRALVANRVIALSDREDFGFFIANDAGVSAILVSGHFFLIGFEA